MTFLTDPQSELAKSVLSGYDDRMTDSQKAYLDKYVYAGIVSISQASEMRWKWFNKGFDWPRIGEWLDDLERIHFETHFTAEQLELLKFKYPKGRKEEEQCPKEDQYPGKKKGKGIKSQKKGLNVNMKKRFNLRKRVNNVVPKRLRF